MLYFNETLRCDNVETWNENYALLLELKQRSFQSACIVLDSMDSQLEKIHVSRFQKGKLVVMEVLEFNHGRCLVKRLEEGNLDTNTGKPVRRGALRMTCPKRHCGKNIAEDWHCQTCGSLRLWSMGLWINISTATVVEVCAVTTFSGAKQHLMEENSKNPVSVF